eukprot:TRINITY_DN39526_c0_g1_i2.p1 TRINITY_DN39526_c0_g1~~TRINITY_DN39526_c0_g1_i2.p1  ORF type:complete len:318 (+),score=148.36 TRINITY_DN39526_c0_g1_i2:111-1064(+)
MQHNKRKQLDRPQIARSRNPSKRRKHSSSTSTTKRQVRFEEVPMEALPKRPTERSLKGKMEEEEQEEVPPSDESDEEELEEVEGEEEEEEEEERDMDNMDEMEEKKDMDKPSSIGDAMMRILGGTGDSLRIDDDDDDDEEEEEVEEKVDPVLATYRKSLDKKALKEERKEKEERRKKREKKLEKLLLTSKEHSVPSVLDHAKERTLRKIATKGVIQLFNAISKAQKVTESSASTDKGKHVMQESKKKFFDVLSGKGVPGSSGEGAATKKQSKGKWSILDDDLMFKKGVWGADHDANEDDDHRGGAGMESEDDEDEHA